MDFPRCPLQTSSRTFLGIIQNSWWCRKKDFPPIWETSALAPGVLESLLHLLGQKYLCNGHLQIRNHTVLSHTCTLSHVLTCRLQSPEGTLCIVHSILFCFQTPAANNSLVASSASFLLTDSLGVSPKFRGHITLPYFLTAFMVCYVH